MAELKYDPRNYRIHTDKNKRLIRKSLEDCERDVLSFSIRMIAL